MPFFFNGDGFPGEHHLMYAHCHLICLLPKIMGCIYLCLVVIYHNCFDYLGLDVCEIAEKYGVASYYPRNPGNIFCTPKVNVFFASFFPFYKEKNSAVWFSCPGCTKVFMQKRSRDQLITVWRCSWIFNGNSSKCCISHWCTIFVVLSSTAYSLE
jgi:hypothetical protein